MKLQNFLKKKLQEVATDMSYGPTAAYRGLGQGYKEYIKTYEKDSYIWKTIFSTILALVYKLEKSNAITREDAEKIIKIYQKPAMINTYVQNNLNNLIFLGKIIPDPIEYPPITKENNKNLSLKFKQLSYDDNTVNLLMFDEKTLLKTFEILKNLKNLHYIFPVGKKYAKFSGVSGKRKTNLLKKVENTKPKNVFDVLVDAAEEKAA